MESGICIYGTVKLWEERSGIFRHGPETATEQWTMENYLSIPFRNLLNLVSVPVFDDRM
jgi:hypothetical protein